MIIFQHIPKTAGSTLHAVFGKRYKKEAIYNTFSSNYSDESVQRLRNLSVEQKSNIELLKGHMPFGLHKYLPTPAKYVTALRDPVKRVVSQYFYIKLHAQNPLHKELIENNWSLGEFVKSGVSVGMNDGQTRWIAGELDAVQFGKTTEDLLYKAISNIDQHYLHVCLTERFEESLLIMGDKLSWSSQPYFRSRNTNKSKRSEDISEEDIGVVIEHNQLDIELYRYASQQLEREAALLPNFSTRLKSFQRRNRVYQLLSGPLSLVGL